MSRFILSLVGACAIIFASCRPAEENLVGSSYGDDMAFLKKHDKSIFELTRSGGNIRAILSPQYQGRVMTTTSAGLDGKSYGWINYDLLLSGEKRKQFNPIGGEERFWLGPEGGQFSLYFVAGDSFKIENWQVPPVIDTETYQVKSKSDTAATFEAAAKLTNYSGTTFDIAITRMVELLNNESLKNHLDISISPDLRLVGYRTVNTITNTGTETWTHEKGLISIWLLGMFTPSLATTIIVPFDKGTNPSLINTDYFGDIPPDRLSIRDSVLLFTADGKYRSKIGFPADAPTWIAGSYDADQKVLTIISFDVDFLGDYVNSKWKIHEKPYEGDAFNAYNDGPLADGTQLGPFYELESSSPVLPLKPGESQTYSQVTCHFEGNFDVLNNLAKELLHIDLNDLNTKP